MLFGSYFHTLDSKGRLLLPSKLLSSLSHNLYMLKGFDGCLSIYCENEFEQYVSKLNEFSYFDKDSRDFLRVALSSVTLLEMDANKRITIPSDVQTHYGISKKVVIIGVIDHLEIWNEDKWHQYHNDKEQDFDNISEALLKHE